MTTYNSLHDLLTKGTNKFGLNLGIISNINDQTYIVHACKNNDMGITAGDSFELSQTYCADVIKDGTTKYFADAAEISEILKHPCYLATQLRAYIGTPITVKGKTWGTLNYSSQSPRKTPYFTEEIEFLEAQAKTVSRLLETR